VLVPFVLGNRGRDQGLKEIAMKNLQVDWSVLETAFEQMGGEFASMNEALNYFDTETGQVIVIDETVSDAMAAIMEDLGEAEIEAGDWTQQDVCRTPSYESLQDWLKPVVLSAVEVEYGDNISRFKSIPQFESHDAFQWMQAFVESVRDDATRKRLSAALEKRKPFHQFRDAIGSDRRLQQDWRAFESARKREGITEWLTSIGVEPINPDEMTYHPPPLVDLRMIMFAEVRRFVDLARQLDGVERIALVGSLATDKEFPKDIDLLVTITDDCDLTELARLGRQLAGHMAAHSSGADVFLASPSGEYLGRTCPWKECRPGVRASCDALSCGVRQYLHDDFESIRLRRAFIEHPPAMLWPDATASKDVPTDVTEQLIGPLSMDPS
jgi:predicted nucleotidyltransferase